MDFYLVSSLEVLSGIATLALTTIGLAIIFGMMRVINLAHGEFLMLGAYTAIVATNAGFNIFVSMLVIAPVFVGLVGLLIERLIIRHLYGRLIDTMLATWGLSLFLIGIVTTIFGNTTAGISSPLAPVTIGDVSVSGYKFFIIAVTVVLFGLLIFLFKRSTFGLTARATMQNPTMASTLGVNPHRTYAITFALGSALAGLAGGVIAPVTGIVPGIGESFVAKAFITVIGGGASVISGTLSASTAFGAINQITSFVSTPVIGEVAMLLAAIVLVRLMPNGITGRFFRRSL